MLRGQTTRYVLLVLLTAGSGAGSAAEPKPQPVTLTTGDGVELSARYFAVSRGQKSPAVIVLDDVGESARPRACDAVARRLAREGCAVLCLDFRGHGGSVAVTPEFWDDATNRRLVRGYKAASPPETIAHAEFRPGYLPALVNDVAAARAYLERRNDVGECNTGQLFVVGFGAGATLGQVWVASEWSRFRATGFQTKLASAPEGRDVAGCMWVAPRFTLDRRAVQMFDLVRRSETKRSAFVGVVHERGDAPVEKFVRQCTDAFNTSRASGLIASESVPEEGGPLASRDEVAEAIDRLIGKMRKASDQPPWDDRDFGDRRYVWALPGSSLILAKDEGETEFRPLPVDRVLAAR